MIPCAQGLLTRKLRLGEVILRLVGTIGHLIPMPWLYLYNIKSRTDNVQFTGGGKTQVYHETPGVWPTVSHLHHYLLAILGVSHPKQGTQGILQMRAGHAVTVIGITIAHAAAMKFVGVVGSLSLLDFLGLLCVHKRTTAEYRCHEKAYMDKSDADVLPYYS